MRDHDSERPGEARALDLYAAAWKKRVQSGDTSEKLLLDAIERSSCDLGAGDGSQRDVLLRLWHKGTDPRKARRTLAWMYLRNLTGLGRLTWRVWRASSSPAWMMTPPTVNLLDFEAGIDVVDLHFEWSPQDGFDTRRLFEAPVGEEGEHEVPAWLGVSDNADAVPVMVGRFRVGYTQLPHGDRLRVTGSREAQGHPYGTLFINADQTDGPQALGLTVALPDHTSP